MSKIENSDEIEMPELTDEEIALIIYDTVFDTRGVSWHNFARLILHFDKDRAALERMKLKQADRVVRIETEEKLRKKVEASRYYKGVE